MKLLNKKLLLIILLLGTFLLIGCNKFSLGTYDASKEEGSITNTVSPTEAAEDSNQNTTKKNNTDADNTLATATPAQNSTPTSAAIQPVPNVELQVYTVNADSGDIKPVPALVPEGSEITPQLIVDTVIESLKDQSINIGIEPVTQDGDTVIVSFKKDSSPASDMGSGYEAAILDAFYQSLVDNLDVKVVYRIEGNAYVSGVFEFGINEEYLGDN